MVQLPATMEMAIYRIVQEALTNVAKHSRAQTVNVQLTSDSESLTVHIADDGQGFDSTRIPASASPTFGLIGMRERARQFHGDVTILSIPGQGTTVSVILPT